MTRRLWLIFSQTVTISVAILFVIATLKPDWLGRNPASIIALREASPAATNEANRVAGFRNASKKALPSVVHIFTSKEVKTRRHPLFDDPVFRHFFGNGDEEAQRSSSLGSGVIVSANGYILTNYHVVESADEIEVALADGRKMRAKVVGTDPDTDLAILQIKSPNSEELKLPAITFGQMESVGVGDIVLAIGNPFGVGQTVTMGIVSALGRSHLGINIFENFIQTDAPINPGNSGGALVDSQGNLIGINTAIYSQSGGSLGIGFAIPVSTVRNVMEQIIATGSVTRGWVGVEAQEITPDLAESFDLKQTEGALIAGVLRGSPADQAGIKPGDILQQVDGKPIKDPQEMLDRIAALKPDSHVPFSLLRNGKPLSIAVNIGKRPAASRGKRTQD